MYILFSFCRPLSSPLTFLKRFRCSTITKVEFGTAVEYKILNKAYNVYLIQMRKKYFYNVPNNKKFTQIIRQKPKINAV